MFTSVDVGRFFGSSRKQSDKKSFTSSDEDSGIGGPLLAFAMWNIAVHVLSIPGQGCLLPPLPYFLSSRNFHFSYMVSCVIHHPSLLHPIIVELKGILNLSSYHSSILQFQFTFPISLVLLKKFIN